MSPLSLTHSDPGLCSAGLGEMDRLRETWWRKCESDTKHPWGGTLCITREQGYNTYRNQWWWRTTYINYYLHNKSSALIIVGYAALVSFTAHYKPSSRPSYIRNCNCEAELLKWPRNTEMMISRRVIFYLIRNKIKSDVVQDRDPVMHSYLPSTVPTSQMCLHGRKKGEERTQQLLPSL